MDENKNLEDQKLDSETVNNLPPEEDLDMSNFSEDYEETGIGVWAKKFGLLVFEVVKVVLISLAIILPIRLFLVQPFYVEGASMEPNFYDKEYLIIDEISYRFNEPQRGQVVIFKNPKNTKVYFIKRIIGLPGETIEVINGKIKINGKELEEDYIQFTSSQSHEPVALANDEYYLLGDNRANSYDSRTIGPINEKYIIGKVWLRGWPFSRINTFNIPDYNYNQ